MTQHIFVLPVLFLQWYNTPPPAACLASSPITPKVEEAVQVLLSYLSYLMEAWDANQADVCAFHSLARPMGRPHTPQWFEPCGTMCVCMVGVEGAEVGSSSPLSIKPCPSIPYYCDR